MTSYHVVGRQSFTKPQRERDNKLLIIFDGGVSFLSKKVSNNGHHYKIRVVLTKTNTTLESSFTIVNWLQYLAQGEI